MTAHGATLCKLDHIPTFVVVFYLLPFADHWELIFTVPKPFEKFVNIETLHITDSVSFD